jgi:hypothetical protein
MCFVQKFQNWFNFNICRIRQTYKVPLKLNNDTHLTKFALVVERIWRILHKLSLPIYKFLVSTTFFFYRYGKNLRPEVPIGGMIHARTQQQQQQALQQQQQQQMAKAPSAIKTNIKAGLQVHPYQRS